jgi:hypothetical protein
MTFPAAALILAVLAPPLHAAPFAELPFAPAPDVATCLRATGAPERTPAPRPRLRVRIPRGQRLYADGRLRVDVACDAACDLRAVVRLRRGGVGASADASLARAGHARLAVAPSSLSPSPWTARTTVELRAGAPGGPVTARRRVRTLVRRRPAPPFAEPLGIRARRTPAGRLIVTWHTAVPARRMTYVVEARPQGGTFESGRFAPGAVAAAAASW